MKGYYMNFSVKKLFMAAVLLGISGQLCALNSPVLTSALNTINKLNTNNVRRGALYGLAAIGSGYLTKWLFGQTRTIYHRMLRVGDLAEINHLRIIHNNGDLHFEQSQHATPMGITLFIGSTVGTLLSAASTVFCGIKALDHIYKAC